ncbi:hypothetical protein RchiOBHm_Chr4g0391761 [Rosa chinensis]|uniref:Uncharacterized protein n=1 Tax=Rosa chinensis TaxID=74649 RepID=A0A2P6QQM5_ROSCH|nr:hypothetical protein RchiOBHm_Chr4g0391761 [Rosa chinensis]
MIEILCIVILYIKRPLLSMRTHKNFSLKFSFSTTFIYLFLFIFFGGELNVVWWSYAPIWQDVWKSGF